jgi:hypothetical protein
MKVNDYDMAKLRDLAASMKGRKGTISLAKPIVSLLPKVKAVNIPGTQAFKVDCKEFCDAVALLELEKSRSRDGRRNRRRGNGNRRNRRNRRLVTNRLNTA